MKMTRREFLQSSGALVIAFNFPLPSYAAGSSTTVNPPTLDGWLAIGQDGRVTVFCGKVELGTGVLTSLSQMVADELDVAFGQVRMIMGDTALVPDQSVTAGSRTIYSGGPQLRQAAATARQVLLTRASRVLNTATSLLTVANGVVSGPGGKRITYAALVKSQKLNDPVNTAVALKGPGQFKLIGQSIPRVELPAIVYGTYSYLHNVRVAGMRHGRVIRPSQPNARLLSVDSSSVSHLPGNVRVLVKGNFVGVVADREEQAIQAAQQLRVTWQPTANLPAMANLYNWMRTAAATPQSVDTAGNINTAFQKAARIFQSSYSTPYQSHASIGPSVAIANVRGSQAVLWSATQSSFNTRGSIATLLGLPKGNVRLIWAEGSGCYGQNGADDVTADAALLSQLAGQPVRVQWMREDEHRNDPKTAAMTTTLRAAVDHNGNITAWQANIWSPNHNERPDGTTAGKLLAGQALGMSGKTTPVGADRNAKHIYHIPNRNITLHLLNSSPVRVSSMRGLGAPHNTFATESFMDELAASAGVDPIAFRLRYLLDPRAIAVVREVARIANWVARPSHQGNRAANSGRGFAFVHYDGYGAYVAIVINITVNSQTGAVSVPQVYVAQDCGLIINPDGVRNQIEGNVIQGLSRALQEQVTFTNTQVTTSNWENYPILRFKDIPQTIQISLLNRPLAQSVGVGEAATVPIFAALANAYYDATGIRKRTIPLFPGSAGGEGEYEGSDG